MQLRLSLTVQTVTILLEDELSTVMLYNVFITWSLTIKKTVSAHTFYLLFNITFL